MLAAAHGQPAGVLVEGDGVGLARRPLAADASSRA